MTIRQAWTAASTASRWKAVGEVLVCLIAIGGLVTGVWGLLLQREVAAAEASSDATQITFRVEELPDQGEGHQAPPLQLQVRNGSKRPVKDGFIFLEAQVNEESVTYRLKIGKMGGCQQRTYSTTDPDVPYAGITTSTLVWRDSVGTRWLLNEREVATEVDQQPSYDESFSDVTSETTPFAGGSCKSG